MLVAVGEHVIVSVIPKEEQTTTGGIILPSTVADAEEYDRGTVLSAAIEEQVGHVARFRAGIGTGMGGRMRVIKAEDIMCIEMETPDGSEEA